jgi:dolichol-phosphate mannosyltransferase
MSSWIGFRRTQVRFTVADRKAGTSKWSVIHLAKLAVGAITSYSAVPLYFSAISGCLFLFLFGLLLLQTLYMKFSGRAVSGFTTVIALQLIIGGTLMIGAGIIGLYLQKIYEEIKGRPRYLIQETAESAPRITSQRPNQA